LRKTRLRPRSAKREALAPERRAFVERILSERPYCEGPAHLRRLMRMEGLSDTDRAAVVVVLNDCGIHRRSTEVHEVLSRARGGSIVDEKNVLALCHDCHAWVTTHPRLATMAGLLKSRWQT
jgi:hypothetical protein